MINYNALYPRMQGNSLTRWCDLLPAQIEQGLDPEHNGNLPNWIEALSQLPDIMPCSIDLDASCIRIGSKDDIDDVPRATLTDQLKRFHPWRKGPFEIFGIHIDAEWRSDWKWDRLKNHIQLLKGRRVLDVGSGNGYYGWRMAGNGASLVIGIDPTLYSVMQYHAMQHFIRSNDVFVLPLGIDDVPDNLEAFDTVFSMGVIYHRREPVAHIQQLMNQLKPGGQLILETLVIDGDENALLKPDGRYAKMRNVRVIPSCLMLENWAHQCDLQNIRIVDVSVTTPEEQRSTEWMTFHSLKDFLDPEESTKTVDGYPVPKRAILVAEKPG